MLLVCLGFLFWASLRWFRLIDCLVLAVLGFAGFRGVRVDFRRFGFGLLWCGLFVWVRCGGDLCAAAWVCWI